MRNAASARPKGQQAPASAAADEALDEIETEHGLNLHERLKLREALVDAMRERIVSETPPPLPMPRKAPELWSNRDGRKENPVMFIRRVYARWFNRGLTRADLRALDQPLYQALAVWIHRHPDEDIFDLVHLTDLLDDPLAEVRALLRQEPRK